MSTPTADQVFEILAQNTPVHIHVPGEDPIYGFVERTNIMGSRVTYEIIYWNKSKERKELWVNAHEITPASREVRKNTIVVKGFNLS